MDAEIPDVRAAATMAAAVKGTAARAIAAPRANRATPKDGAPKVVTLKDAAPKVALPTAGAIVPSDVRAIGIVIGNAT